MTLTAFTSTPEIEPVEGESTRFWVKSASQRDLTHLVDLDYDGGAACSCQDHQCRGRQCKHIHAVKRKLITAHA